MALYKRSILLCAASARGIGSDVTVPLSVGITADGTVNRIAFTELHETPSMGALCGEDAFKEQFTGVPTDRFILNKAGGSTADNEIDNVTGASTTNACPVCSSDAAEKIAAVTGVEAQAVDRISKARKQYSPRAWKSASADYEVCRRIQKNLFDFFEVL